VGPDKPTSESARESKIHCLNRFPALTSAPFAFKIARVLTGSIRGGGGGALATLRVDHHPVANRSTRIPSQAFMQAKKQKYANLAVRWVEEPRPLQPLLLEV
jgi:hypothetical protein